MQRHLQGWTVNWHEMFVPSGSLIELVLRGTIMYLGSLFLLRLMRREAGEISRPDLLVVLLVADAAQNGMAGQYQSITEGLVLIATIFGWSYVLDYLSYRSETVQRILSPPPLLLVRNGRMIPRHLRAELLTTDDLMSQLRAHGVERLNQVKRCYVESDGKLSVIPFEPVQDNPELQKRTH